MIRGQAITRESTQTGSSAGSASGVTPPIIMPVSSRVSSASAKRTLRTAKRLRTVWFTSRRVCASTTQAA